MIALVAMLAVGVVLFLIVPAISTAVARSVVNSVDRGPSSGSIDQSLVEARLTRIEEAIDAMALQIERLSDHQRSLLGTPASPPDDVDRERPG